MPVWSRGWTAVQRDSCCSSIHIQSRKQLLAGKPWQQRTQPRPADTESIQGLPDSICRPWWLRSNDSSTIRLSTTAAVRSLGCLEWELAHSDAIFTLLMLHYSIQKLHTSASSPDPLRTMGPLCQSCWSLPSNILFFFQKVLRAAHLQSTYWICAKYHVCSHSVQASDLRATTSSSSVFLSSTTKNKHQIASQEKLQRFLVKECRHMTSAQYKLNWWLLYPIMKSKWII